MGIRPQRLPVAVKQSFLLLGDGLHIQGPLIGQTKGSPGKPC